MTNGDTRVEMRGVACYKWHKDKGLVSSCGGQPTETEYTPTAVEGHITRDTGQPGVVQDRIWILMGRRPGAQDDWVGCVAECVQE
jgi:hypothetical protein